MSKQNTITAEKFNQTVLELVELWQADQMHTFAQRFLSLRHQYSKTVVNKLLQQATSQALLKNEIAKRETNVHGVNLAEEVLPEFTEFEIGSTVEVIKDVWSGGSKNKRLVTIGEHVTVYDNNHLNSNRYIVVSLAGTSKKLVALASNFRAVPQSAPLHFEKLA